MTVRGVLKVANLRARSVRASNGTCWLWQGATSDGLPRIWTYCHDVGDKRCMSGPAAVWNIAFGRGTKGGFAYRCCGTKLCVNPVHVRLAPTKAAMFAAISSDGRFKGTHVAARRASIELAHVANGITPTPADVVRSIRADTRKLTNTQLGALHGIAHSTVSRIKRFNSHKGVV